MSSLIIKEILYFFIGSEIFLAIEITAYLSPHQNKTIKKGTESTSFLKNFYFVELQLIYNVVLIFAMAKVLQLCIYMYTYTHIFFSIFFPMTDYHRIWNTRSCAYMVGSGLHGLYIILCIC